MITDVEELKKFYDNVLPELEDFEVYFVSLSARKKYLTDAEREIYQLRNTEMFDRKIIKQKNWNTFYRTIRKFDAHDEAYLTEEGYPIPRHCMTVYININPSSTIKALNEFYKETNTLITDLALNVGENKGTDHVTKRLTKLDKILMTALQKNQSKKRFLDIDFDIDKSYYDISVKDFTDFLEVNGINYYVVETRGGYHVLMVRNTINCNFHIKLNQVRKNIIEEYNQLRAVDNFQLPITNDFLHGNTGMEVLVNKNDMIALPGTTNGGFTPKVIKEG